MSDGHDALLYWDPVPHIEAAFRSLRAEWPENSGPLLHRGKWEERNWRNVPGPLYGAMTDNCWVGRLRAPRHVLYGDDEEYEQEFLYRQPRSGSELRNVLMATWEDPCCGWARDGDSHWTPDLVRGWWRDRPRLRQWITAKRRVWGESTSADEREAAVGLTDYLTYLDNELADHLQAYIYFLDHGHGPTLGQPLPTL